MQTGFYGLLPSYVRHNTNLKPSSKVLYSEITACLESDGICIKKNIYFSKALGINKSTISNCLTELRKEGFIHVVLELEEGTNKFLKRYITPINIQGGVMSQSELTPTDNLGGDSNNASLNISDTPSKLGQTLLLHNNIVNKVYTNAQKRDTLLNKGINQKQYSILNLLVELFYETQRERFPSMINAGWKNDKSIINGSINTLYDIIKIDNFKYEDVRDVLKWALDDKFWGKNLLSLRTLRNKSDNGFTKFQNLYHRYTNQS